MSEKPATASLSENEPEGARSRPQKSPRSENTGRTPAARAAAKPRKAGRKPTPPEEDDLATDWLDESPEPSWNQPSMPPRQGAKPATGGAKPKTRNKSPLFILLIVGGVGALVVGVVGIVAVATVFRGIGNSRSSVGGAADVSIPDVASIAIPANVFPPRPTFQPTFGSGVLLARTRLTGSGPGEATQMNIYLPPGEHTDGSIGCVLVAPAGTNLLVGNSLDGDDYHDETLPYAEAGFMTIQYSLDGSVPDLETASDAQFAAAYQKFKAAGAGTLNTRAVIEYVKSRFPEVDSGRIYTAGHSSAGTVSLLAAENLSDVAACIAYAPCSDTEAFHADFSNTWGIDRLFPGIKEFDRQYSPVANVHKLKCPVFVFQARDDSVVEVAETRRFAEKAKSSSSQAEYVEVANGDHYDSMISQGIPGAIDWLKKIDSQRSSQQAGPG